MKNLAAFLTRSVFVMISFIFVKNRGKSILKKFFNNIIINGKNFLVSTNTELVSKIFWSVEYFGE